MVSLYNWCHFYLILTLTTCTDAVNITAALGSSVCLPCESHLYSNSSVTVTWRKNESSKILCQYRVDSDTATNIQKCSLEINQTAQPPTLCISGVKTGDAGYYNCSVFKSIPPPSNEMFYLMELHIKGPPLVIIKSQNQTSNCLLLLCELNGLDSAQGNFTWSRNGNRLSETTNRLHLCNNDWSEGDTFTCKTSQYDSHANLSASINIAITKPHTGEAEYRLIIICGSALTGALVLISLVICIYKCKSANSSDEAMVYTNKVYANISYSTTCQPTQENVTRPREECIYEN